MKKAVLLSLLLAVLVLAGCSREIYTLELAIPPGDGSVFHFSTQEILPKKAAVTLSGGAGVVRVEVVLIPVDHPDVRYGAYLLTQDEPAVLQLEEGVWYRIGVAMPNDSPVPAAIELELEDVELRIP